MPFQPITKLKKEKFVWTHQALAWVGTCVVCGERDLATKKMQENEKNEAERKQQQQQQEEQQLLLSQAQGEQGIQERRKSMKPTLDDEVDDDTNEIAYMLSCFHAVCRGPCSESLLLETAENNESVYRCRECKTDTSQEFIKASRLQMFLLKKLAREALTYTPRKVPCAKCEDWTPDDVPDDNFTYTGLPACKSCNPIQFMCPEDKKKHIHKNFEIYSAKMEWEGVWRCLLPTIVATQDNGLPFLKGLPGESGSPDREVSPELEITEKDKGSEEAAEPSQSKLRSILKSKKEPSAQYKRLEGAGKQRDEGCATSGGATSGGATSGGATSGGATSGGATKSKTQGVRLEKHMDEEEQPLLHNKQLVSHSLNTATSVLRGRRGTKRSLSVHQLKQLKFAPRLEEVPTDRYLESVDEQGEHFRSLRLYSLDHIEYLEGQLTSVKRSVQMLNLNFRRCLGNEGIEGTKQALQNHVGQLMEAIEKEEKFAELCLRGACQVAFGIKILYYWPFSSREKSIAVKNNLKKLFDKADFDRKHVNFFFYDLELFDFPNRSSWYLSLLGSQPQVEPGSASCRIPICTIPEFHPRRFPKAIHYGLFDNDDAETDKPNIYGIAPRHTLVVAIYGTGDYKRYVALRYFNRASTMVNEVDMVSSENNNLIGAVQIATDIFAVTHEDGIKIQMTGSLPQKYQELPYSGGRAFGKGLWWSEKKLYALQVNSTIVFCWTWWKSTFFLTFGGTLELQGARNFSSDDTLIVSGGKYFVCYYNIGNGTPVPAKDFLFCFDGSGDQIPFCWKDADSEVDNCFIHPFLTCRNRSRPSKKLPVSQDDQLLMLCDGNPSLTSSRVKVLAISQSKSVEWVSLQLWNEFGEVMIKDIRIAQDGSLHYRGKGNEAVQLLLPQHKNLI